MQTRDAGRVPLSQILPLFQINAMLEMQIAGGCVSPQPLRQWETCSGHLHSVGSFLGFDDLEVHLQELPVRQFINAHLGGNLHRHVL